MINSESKRLARLIQTFLDVERLAVRSQYRHFVVDEYQDVNALQQRLLELWVGERDDLCVVGDPAQTIYSFAGANSTYLRDFAKKFPNAASVELVRNYRSSPEIVTAANGLLAGSESRGVELRAQRPSGPAVTFTALPDEVAEAEHVAARIGTLRDQGRSLGEVAVLFRINAQSEAYEDALSSRGIPYVIRGAARFFDRPEVREAVTRLRGAARSGEGDEFLETVHGTLSGMGWTSQAPTSRGQTRDRWESWQALIDQATAFAKTPGATLGEFVDDLDRRASEQNAPVADGVTLATFHAAKGLEWDSVFLCGLQDGTLPITYADTPAAVEEERRLLYVGMTRARVDLALSWSLARNPGGRASRKPSRFLDALLPDDHRAPQVPTLTARSTPSSASSVSTTAALSAITAPLLIAAGVAPPPPVEELIDLAKREPGKLNYASVGNGSSSHLNMELLKSVAGFEAVHVPFNGSPPAVTDTTTSSTNATTSWSVVFSISLMRSTVGRSFFSMRTFFEPMTFFSSQLIIFWA